jgi:hypothetical protein
MKVKLRNAKTIKETNLACAPKQNPPQEKKYEPIIDLNPKKTIN